MDLAIAEPERSKRAVIYLRVSTAKQVKRDDDPDGCSLPAQRDACEHKAESLDAEVVAEFVDRGESAKTADRREFQKMLVFVKQQGDIDYVILDKVDRFARNRRDDANIMFELKTVGTTLVSVKENIDETPGGQLLHAIMAGIAEFYSRNLATEALKGMTQKAKFGGTPGRAPVGYLNTRQRIEGREVAIVIIDPERAPLIRWAFEAYATGEWTIRTITEALAEKGLKALPHGPKVPGPLAPSHVSRVLRNRYYIGKVLFNGTEYEGRHEPLISDSLFQRVQEVLKAHDLAGEKQRVHNHYLKGTVACAWCGSRLCITRAKQYFYLFCLGRHQRRTDCTMPYLSVEAVEQAVERYYASVRFTEAEQDEIRTQLRAELDRQHAQSDPELQWAKRRVAELTEERRRLARGVVTGSIPEDLAHEEQARIARELRGAQNLLVAAETVYESVEETLRLALAWVGRCGDVYQAADARIRRLSNQAIFKKLLVEPDDDGPVVTGVVLREPYASLAGTAFQRATIDRTPASDAANLGHDLVPGRDLERGRGSKEINLVARVGFEPTLSVV
ncbi:recombinase family protein [Pseudofrankia saprophytica]|uniref:recombinase family protein n=1 Tax=Pseudofrankia saprophytica TaxID=298655 RepID=UPI003CC91E33